MERDANRSLARWMKTTSESMDAWGVFAELNDLFGKWHKYVWQTPKLIERIVERCRVIFESPCFDLSWLEIEFQERGPIISVEGDRCLVYPCSEHDYADHNVDNSQQAFCLYLCLQAALDEIDIATQVWEEHGLDHSVLSDNCQRTFRFTKDTSKFELYQVEIWHPRDPELDCIMYAWTKDRWRLQDRLQEQPELFEADVSLRHIIEPKELLLIPRTVRS